MSKKHKYGTWQKEDCPSCGAEFQITRTEPREFDEIPNCSECQIWDQAYIEGYGAATTVGSVLIDTHMVDQARDLYQSLIKSFLEQQGWQCSEDGSEWSKGDKALLTDEEAFYAETGK